MWHMRKCTGKLQQWVWRRIYWWTRRRRSLRRLGAIGVSALLCGRFLRRNLHAWTELAGSVRGLRSCDRSLILETQTGKLHFALEVCRCRPLVACRCGPLVACRPLGALGTAFRIIAVFSFLVSCARISLLHLHLHHISYDWPQELRTAHQTSVRSSDSLLHQGAKESNELCFPGLVFLRPQTKQWVSCVGVSLIIAIVVESCHSNMY